MVSYNIYFISVLCNVLQTKFSYLDDKNMLQKIKENMIKSRPFIHCKKLNFDDGNKKKADKMATCIDENRNQHKTERKNCDHQITSLSIPLGKLLGLAAIYYNV